MDPYRVEYMTVDDVKVRMRDAGDMSGPNSRAKVVSYHVNKLSAYLLEGVNRLEPLERRRKTLWTSHMAVFQDPVKKLVERVLGHCLETAHSVVELVKRRDVADYLPELDKICKDMEDILAGFGEKEFTYISMSNQGVVEHKCQIPPRGLSEDQVESLEDSKEKCTLVRKIAMCINTLVIDSMDIPKKHIGIGGWGVDVPSRYHVLNYMDPGFCLGPTLKRYLKPGHDRPLRGDQRVKLPSDLQLNDVIGPPLSTQEASDFEEQAEVYRDMRYSKALNVASKLEQALEIWKIKMGCEPAKASKYKRYILNARHLLQLINLEYILPPSSFFSEKIKSNEDMGRAFLESYSKAVERLAIRVIGLIDDVLTANSNHKPPRHGRHYH